jgi:hypothetical protein
MFRKSICVRLVGVVRLGEEGAWFEPDQGRKWSLTLPVAWWARPRLADERGVMEGVDEGDGWLRVRRLMPLGWDVGAGVRFFGLFGRGREGRHGVNP